MSDYKLQNEANLLFILLTNLEKTRETGPLFALDKFVAPFVLKTFTVDILMLWLNILTHITPLVNIMVSDYLPFATSKQNNKIKS